MSHFAEINSDNIVQRVIVAEQDFINSGAVGDSFNWVQTSYNGNFRKNYAGTGYTYDKSKDCENNEDRKIQLFNLDMASANSLVTTSLDLTKVTCPTSSSLTLNTSHNNISSLVPSRSMDLTCSKISTISCNLALRTSPKSVKWKCEICEATISWGLTLERALHTEKHKKQKDSVFEPSTAYHSLEEG